MDCSPPGSSVHEILQARILEWVAISSSRGSFQPRDWIHVSCISCTGRWTLYHWATWEALNWKLSQTNSGRTANGPSEMKVWVSHQVKDHDNPRCLLRTKEYEMSSKRRQLKIPSMTKWWFAEMKTAVDESVLLIWIWIWLHVYYPNIFGFFPLLSSNP